MSLPPAFANDCVQYAKFLLECIILAFAAEAETRWRSADLLRSLTGHRFPESSSSCLLPARLWTALFPPAGRSLPSQMVKPYPSVPQAVVQVSSLIQFPLSPHENEVSLLELCQRFVRTLLTYLSLFYCLHT